MLLGLLRKLDFRGASCNIKQTSAPLFVLEGARETLLRCRPVLTVEQKAHGTRYSNVERHASVDFLKSLGAEELQRVLDDWIIGWR